MNKRDLKLSAKKWEVGIRVLSDTPTCNPSRFEWKECLGTSFRIYSMQIPLVALWTQVHWENRATFDALSITFDKSLITGKKEALKNSFLTKKSGASGWLMSQFGKSLITR